MESKELVNYSSLSELLTGRNDIIRKERISKTHKAVISELILLIDYWKFKNKL